MSDTTAVADTASIVPEPVTTADIASVASDSVTDTTSITEDVVVDTLHILGAEADGNSGVWIIIVIFLGIFVALLWRFRKNVHTWWSEGILKKAVWPNSDRLKAFARSHVVVVLILLLLLQVMGAFQQMYTLGVRDLLFEAPASPVEVPLIITVEDMKCWVREGDFEARYQYIGWLFLLTLVAGWGLYFVLNTLRGRKRRFWETTLSVTSALLLMSQTTLLPVNYGILLSTSRYPEVSVSLRAADKLQTEHPRDMRLALVHETKEGFYLYSGTKQELWYILREEVQSIVYYGLVNVLDKTDTPTSCQRR